MQKKAKKMSRGISQKGFTVIEVMLVLAITGLLLVGVLGSSFGSIQFQRYEDSVNSFAESLRSVYNEVLNPRSDQGGVSDTAMYGKMITFASGGGGKFYTVTLVGNVTPPEKETSFLGALRDVSIKPKCDTVEEHAIAWGAKVYDISDRLSDRLYDTAIIIARSPVSGAVHTVSTNKGFAVEPSHVCETLAYYSTIRNSINSFTQGDTSAGEYSMDKDINFCVRSDGNDEIPRVVQIKADGSNTSAVTVLDESESSALGCRLQMNEGESNGGP